MDASWAVVELTNQDELTSLDLVRSLTASTLMALRSVFQSTTQSATIDFKRPEAVRYVSAPDTVPSYLAACTSATSSSRPPPSSSLGPLAQGSDQDVAPARLQARHPHPR